LVGGAGRRSLDFIISASKKVRSKKIQASNISYSFSKMSNQIP